jgi:excisionase family DNA binding protein
MPDNLESALKTLLKIVVREVAADLREELQAPAPIQAPSLTPSDEDFLLTPRETAKRLAISERHLFQLTRDGELPCVRVGKCVRYNVETIRKWIRDAESKGSPERTAKDAPTQTPSKPPALTSPRRSSKRSKVQKRRGPVVETDVAPARRSPVVRRPNSNTRPPAGQSEERVSPLTALLGELGIDGHNLPPITNGELMRIAEVDIVAMHGWEYLGKALPEEALRRLRNHFRRLVTESSDGK